MLLAASPSGKRALVGNRQIHAQQAKDRAGKALRLTRVLVETQPQGQHGFDRQISTNRITLGGASVGHRPMIGNIVGDPDSDVAALTQRCRVGSPIRHTKLGFRSLVAAGGVDLEWHALGSGKRSEGALPPCHRFPSCAPNRPLSAQLNKPFIEQSVEFGSCVMPKEIEGA